jgi:hypothetical protein
MNRRIVSWLAIFGIAFNALWPLIANAAPVDVFNTICTTDKSLQASQQAPAKKIPASSSSPHCPFCLGASDDTPVLTAGAAASYQQAFSALAAMVAGTVAPPSFAYTSAASRGPPVLP